MFVDAIKATETSHGKTDQRGVDSERIISCWLMDEAIIIIPELNLVIAMALSNGAC